MATLRIPVFVWRDHSGNQMAIPVDTWPYSCEVAVGSSVENVLRQVRDTLLFRMKIARDDGDDLPIRTRIDYQIRSVKIVTRPRYVHEERYYPLTELVEFQMPVLVGNESPQALRCYMPMIDEWFSCFVEDDYKRIAGEKYRETLVDMTPEEILFDYPAKEWRLEHVSLPLKAPKHRTRKFDLKQLERVARPLQTALGKRSQAAWCRDDVVRNLAMQLVQSGRNIAIVGPEGCGRSTVLAAAVRQIEKDRKQKHNEEDGDKEAFVKHQYWVSSASHLIAGLRYLGQWQERLEKIIAELASFDGVLYIENLADLVRLGGEGDESIAGFFVPYIETGIVRMVGKITHQELDVLRQLLGSFIDKFHIFHLEAMSDVDASRALTQMGESLIHNRQTSGNLSIKDDVFDLIVRLCKRFYPYQPLPGKAAMFLKKIVEQAQKIKLVTVDSDFVIRMFLQETGLPDWMLRDDIPMSFDEINLHLTGRIIGQYRACEFATQAIVNFKAAMNHPNRPICSMLFCGPTGVGKTQLAKTLAGYLFENLSPDDETQNESKPLRRLFRLDMSEYSYPWSATRLIEKEDGTPSALIQHVRRHPFSVVLFDEIEKADPGVFDMLLGLFDEGRLTDRLGRTTNFQSTIIIMTSNLGSGDSAGMGFGSADGSHRFSKAVRDFFRPEFFNRIDAVVSFGSLDPVSCRKIVQAEITRLTQREGLVQRQITISASDDFIDDLVARGFDARYGARPLQRLIESTILPLLAERILNLPTKAGQHIVLNIDDCR